MDINSISSIINTQSTNAVQSKSDAAKGEFSDIFKEAIQQAEQTQTENNAGTLGLLTGESTDLHTIMIQAEKADLALKLTIQIRNKILDSYSEIMRMQV